MFLIAITVIKDHVKDRTTDHRIVVHVRLNKAGVQVQDRITETRIKTEAHALKVNNVRTIVASKTVHKEIVLVGSVLKAEDRVRIREEIDLRDNR